MALMMSKSRSIDITGQKFGKLTAIRLDHKKYNCQEFWEFYCDCGMKVVKNKNHVKRGSISSCGCIPRIKARDITGQRFNRLTAVRFDHVKKENKKSYQHWLFKCDCGNEKAIPKSPVVRGKIKTCGCSKKAGGLHKMVNKKRLNTHAEYEAVIKKLKTCEKKVELNDNELINFSILAGLALGWEQEHGRGGMDSAVNEPFAKVMERQK